MERYTVWRDAYTGLHPFLPYAPKGSNGRNAILSLFNALLKIVPAFLSFLLFFTVDVVTALLIPVHIIRWTLLAITGRLLMVCGC